MAKTEKSSPRVATMAAMILRSPATSKTARSLAGSALSQAGTAKETTPATARAAAKALNDARVGGNTRTLAGSVLTQKPKKR